MKTKWGIYKGKRLEDMSRVELYEAINNLAGLYAKELLHPIGDKPLVLSQEPSTLEEASPNTTPLA